MTTKILVEIVATDKGLKVIQRNMDNLSRATDDVSKKTRGAANSVEDLYSKQNKGVIGTANSTKSFSKLAQTIGSGGGGLVGAYATLAANAFAVSAAFESLRTGAQVNQIMAGLELQGARTGRALTLTAKGIQDITQGALSASDSMSAAAMGTAAGLNRKDIQELTKVATNASLALGRSVPDSMERVIKGVTKLEPELLDELGLMTKLTEASENYARSNSKSAASLTRFEKSLAFVEAIKLEGANKFGGIAEEIGVNQLDKLGASFKNLAHEMSGSVATSTTMTAIISVLTDSTYGLGAALALLGAYVAKQFTGGLIASTKATLVASQALGDQAKKLRELRDQRVGSTKALLDGAKAESQAAVAAGRRAAPKSLDMQNKALAGDQAAQAKFIKLREDSNKRYDKQLKELTRTHDDEGKKLKALRGEEKKEHEKKIARITEAKLANQNMINSMATQQTAQTNYSRAVQQTITQEIRSRAAQQGSIMLSRASTAMEAAGVFNLKAAYTNVLGSMKSHAKELRLIDQANKTTASSSGLMAGGINALRPAAIGARVALHGLTLGVKTLGVAFATALPWIAVITIAFSMAQAAYENFFKTTETKAKEKALEDLNTVLETLSKSAVEFDKVQKSTNISIGEKALKALTIQTNAMVELTDAYLAFTEASARAGDAASKSSGAIEFLSTASASDIGKALSPITALQTMGKAYDDFIKFMAPSIDETALKKELGLVTDTAAKAAQSLISPIDTITDLFFGDGLSDLEKPLLSTIDKIAVYDKKLAESIVLTGDFDKDQETVRAALTKAQPVWKRAQLAVQNFAESIKTAETAQADFMRSIIPSTKFDVVLGSFTSLNKSILDIQKTLGDSRFEDSTFSELLTNLGPSTARILDISDQLNLDAVKTQYAEISSLQGEIKGLQESGRGATKESLDKEAKVAQLKDRIKTALKNSEPSILLATREYQKQLTNSQVMAITMQGNLAIAQASLSVLQKRGAVTANDAAKQLKAENAIIGLQQEQLRAEKVFLDIDIAKQQNRLKELEDNVKLLKTLKELGAEERKRLLDQSMKTNLAQAESARAKGDEKAANIFESKNATLERARVNAAEEYNRSLSEQEDLENDVRRSKAGSVALGKQIAALGMQANSGAEINAAKSRKKLEIDSQRAAILREESVAMDSIGVTTKEISSMIRMTNDDLEIQLLKINNTADQKKRALDEEHSQKLRALDIEEKLAKAQGLKDRVKHYKEEKDLELSRYATASRTVEVEKTRDSLQLVAIKNKIEELQLTREIYDIQQKSLDTVRELSDARLEESNTLRDLEAKRLGVSDSAALNTIKAIKAAEAAKKLANDEFKQKSLLIELEYDLLEAQRLLLIDQLTSRRKVIADEKAAINKSSQNEGRLDANGQIVVEANSSNPADKQLALFDSIISRLTSTSYSDARSNAQAILGTKADTAANAAALAKSEGPRTKGGFVSQQAEMKLRVEAGTEQGRSGSSPLGVSSTVLEEMDSYVSSIKETLSSLGPDGEILLAAATSAINIGNSFVDAFTIMGDSASTSSQKTVAALQAVSAVIAGVASILKSTSDAKIANIDKEIAAEERRDGKSAASVEKIKGMQKKKDDTARKSFDIQKKLMMAQAVVSTAAAIAMAIGQLGPIAGPIMAGVMAAMGAAQIAIIAGTSYESPSSSAITMPSTLSIGKRSDTVDLAKGPNANAGGEAGYLRGNSGMGSNASNYRTVGSAYGGELFRGYGNRGFVVGEKGPEVISPDTPVNVTPANDTSMTAPVNATINIQALDSTGVQDILVQQKGNLISMLREAANASGQRFLEDVNVNVYTRPNTNRL